MMSFLSPIYLLGLAGVAIPVVIHLFYRRRVRNVRFSSLMLLRELVRLYSARQRLHELLVLLLRCAAITALVLALAKPVLRTETASGSATVACAIILDDTYSMECKKGTVSRLVRARQTAEAILRTLSRRDSALLIRLSSPDEPIGGSVSSITEEVGKIGVAFGQPRLKEAVQRALSFLEGADQLNRELHIIGDMQRRTYDYITKEEFRAECGDKVQLIVTDVGDDDAVNAAVMSAEVIRDLRHPEQLCIEATVQNFAERELTISPKLLYEGQKRPTESFTLSRGAKETVRLYVPVSSVPRDVGASIRIEGDSLETDNRWFFRLGRPVSIDIILVNGDPSQLPEMDEVFYLRFALSPVEPSTGVPLSDIRPFVVPFFRLERSKLSDFRVLILANVDSLSGTFVRRLTEFVENGGGLVLFCGERIRLESYNRWLPKLAGLRLIEKVSYNAPLQLDAVDYTHPIFRKLASVAPFSVPLVRFWRILRVEPTEEDVNILAAYSNGDAAVVERTFGKGRVVVVTSTCDRDWTNLPVRTVFLPFVQGLVRYCAGEREERKDFVVGEEVRVRVEGGRVSLEHPDGREEELNVHTEGGDSVRFIPRKPGIYTVSDGKSRTIIGVNADRDESDIERVSAEALPKTDNIHYITDRTDVSSFLERLRTGVKLWNYFLVAALLFLFLELLLSNRRLPSFRSEETR